MDSIVNYIEAVIPNWKITIYNEITGGENAPFSINISGRLPRIHLKRKYKNLSIGKAVSDYLLSDIKTSSHVIYMMFNLICVYKPSRKLKSAIDIHKYKMKETSIVNMRSKYPMDDYCKGYYFNLKKIKEIDQNNSIIVTVWCFPGKEFEIDKYISI